MSHSNCPVCGLPVVHFSTDEVEENAEMHAACVAEVNADLDAQVSEDGDDFVPEENDVDEDDLAEDGEEFYYDGGEMDGDHESALASAGFGTDEDYGCFGGDDY